MKSLRFFPSEKKLKLVEIPVPELTEYDNVLVKVIASGLCGTDLHIVAGEFSSISSETVTLGHEFAGLVEAVGPGVTQFKVGDRVGVDPNSSCGSCEFCHRGQVQFCITGALRSCTGIIRNGGFAEFCKVPAKLLSKLDDGLTFRQGALCEPLACILHGYDRLQKMGPVQPDSKILILGAGIIGNLWASMLHHLGHRNVVVSELQEQRREIARKMKTGYKVYSPDNLAALMPKTSVGAELSGFDVIVECTGNPEAIEQAVPWARRGGVVCVFGCSPVGKTMRLCPEELFSKELVLFGTMIDPLTYARSISLAANMAKDNYLDLDKLGVEVFKLDEYPKALDKLAKGNISKAMFDVGGQM